jgi:hypothetical protein
MLPSPMLGPSREPKPNSLETWECPCVTRAAVHRQTRSGHLEYVDSDGDTNGPQNTRRDIRPTDRMPEPSVSFSNGMRNMK